MLKRIIRVAVVFCTILGGAFDMGQILGRFIMTFGVSEATASLPGLIFSLFCLNYVTDFVDFKKLKG